MSAPGEYDLDICIQAASALLLLDPWDERAVVALAEGLARSGRKIAARDFLADFAGRYERELEEQPSEDVKRAAVALNPRLVNRNLTNS